SSSRAITEISRPFPCERIRGRLRRFLHLAVDMRPPQRNSRPARRRSSTFPRLFSTLRHDDTVSRMTDAPDPKYREMFPAWLRSLGEDAGALGTLVSGNASADVKRHVIAGLNYIFKSLDLIPDGIDDLGFMDDAFVLRVACAFAVDARPDVKKGVVQRLS